MHNLDLILTLTYGLGAALVFGYITQRLGLSPIVGYLLAGVAVGPHTPGIHANREIAEQLAEVGRILLMFGVGLHFHIKELLAVRRVAIPGAVGQSLIATLLGAWVAHAFGLGWLPGIVFGMAISVASTVVLIRVLSDNNDLHTPAGHIAVGWLVVEDLFTVLALVLLPALGRGEEGQPPPAVWSIVLALALALVKISLLVAFTFGVAGRIIPWILEHVAATRSRELFTLTVLVVALGIAIGSATFFDASVELGAFLAGMIVGRSEFSLRAAAEALPMRDAFAVLFFVSIGLLLDPMQLINAPGLICATLAVILLGKPLAAFLIVVLLRYPLKTALIVSVALAQIGEFSFILASLAEHQGILPETAMATLVPAAIISITLNPLLYRTLDPIERWAMRFSALRNLGPKVQAKPYDGESALDEPQRAVIVGFGPVGRTVARLLKENDVLPVIIELNLDTVRKLRADGFESIYGDSRHRETLVTAGVSLADSLILSSAGMQGIEEVIRQARELNPDVQILARAAYTHERAKLREAGADQVFSGEGEVALALTEAILKRMGATPDQIDRERARVRADLFGTE